MRELALWGARSLGPPTDRDELFEGWLANAMDIVMAPVAPAGRFEFRAGPEVASLVDGEVVDGPIDDADVVVEGDPEGIYSLFVDRCLDRVTIDGDQASAGRAPRCGSPRAEMPVADVAAHRPDPRRRLRSPRPSPGRRARRRGGSAAAAGAGRCGGSR